MRSTRKVISLLLAVCLLLGNLPVISFASTQQDESADSVYISVSYDGQYINDQNGAPIAYVPVSFEELAAVDLDAYGLAEYCYDEDGDGAYDITALHLVIYAHENLYGGDWSDVTFTGAPGSSYFQGGIFGFDENLNYYLNGQYPLASAGWGATSDQIVLKAGDFLDIASFSSWDFYQDTAYGFHFFADGNGDITHRYTVDADAELNVNLVLGTKDWEYNSVLNPVPGYEVFYGTAYGTATGSVVTDDSGSASITFPTAGTWYLWVNGGYGNEYPEAIVSSPGYAVVTVATEEPREAQDVSAVLNATMEKLAATVTAPVFGTNAGEWTVLGLARGGYFAKDNAYFTDYYDRIVETVNTTAASVDMSGALHKNKSTENSRLIVALSAIGKNATSVGNWDLVEAYSANGFDWIKKQGLNGTIWALIALDSNNYVTSNETIRQQCVDAILAAQHDDGGWALQANLAYASDPDVTGMALTALYPYCNQPEVAAACEEAFACLSAMQHDNGTFASGGSECSESCAWVIVACTTWGINPDTDSRFIKNGKSVVDGLLAHYLEDEAQFQHIIGAGVNGMATDQSCYALVAYDRFVKGKVALYDYTDVTFDPVVVTPEQMEATLGLPEKINPGVPFNGSISINMWDNEAGFKLIDFVMSIPNGVEVNGVTVGSKLSGGQLCWNLDSEGKLRVVYFDANQNSDLIITGDAAGAELFNIQFKAQDEVAVGQMLTISVEEMSVKLGADSEDEENKIDVDTETAKDITVEVVEGLSFSANVLYTGDGVDLIAATKKAVAVAVTGIDRVFKLIYTAGETSIEFQYSAEITAKTGVTTYVALVDASIETGMFTVAENFNLEDADSAAVTFGDADGNGVINAQDALAAVDAWLRKGDAPTDTQILILNVNGDSRINTFDALGIVENFVSGAEFGVVTKAATAQR